MDQRVSTRTEEMAALGQAITIMTQAMAPKKAALLAQSDDIPLLYDVATVAAASPTVLASAENEADAIESQDGDFNMPVAFLQRRNDIARHKPHVSKMEELKFERQRQALLQFLTDKAMLTKSSRFVMLAQSVENSRSGDVFDKIKEMIANLIANLQKQAQESQTKKAYCDKSISESSVKRDTAAKKVLDYNNEMVAGEARRDTLTEEITLLAKEIADLNATKTNATNIRNQEKSQSDASIDESETALEGVRQAIAVLKAFYGKAKDKKVQKPALALEDASPAKDAPDAGFKNMEANTGAQSAATGIFGMLEVIESDFVRAIQETKTSEQEAEAVFKKLCDETEVSTTQKKEAIKTKTQFKSETLDKLSNDQSNMKTQNGVLISALNELAALDKECGAGAGYNERKAAREMEIKQLKDAIAFFDGFLAQK